MFTTEQTRTMVNPIHKTIEQMSQIADTIMNKQKTRLTLAGEIVRIRELADRIKTDITLQTAEQGTNDTKRKALCEMELANHSLYQSHLMAINGKQNEINLIDIEIEHERKVYEWLKLIVESENTSLKLLTV